MRYGKTLNPTATPQTEPVPGKDQVANSAGGYSFQLDKWKQLERFLILGTEKGTYYISEQKLTLANAQSALECIKADGMKAIKMAVDVSHSGRASKNDSAIFVLALAIKYGSDEVRKHAYASIPTICRTGTHMFTLAQALTDLGKGWGRGLKSAIAKWYLGDANKIAYQVAKYQSRNVGDKWSNADLLRLSHPKTTDPALNALFKWVVDGEETPDVPALIKGFELAKKATSAAAVVSLILEYGLPRECVPTQYVVT